MTLRHGMIGLALAALAAGPALAQTQPPVQTEPAAPVDPARLAAAKALISRVMPPERIDAMIDQMMRPMLANLRGAMLQSPELQAGFAKDPQAKGVIDQFIGSEFARATALTKESMPMMLDAMARAYARRFTAAQLGEIRAFFETPVGKLYAEQAGTILTDPDVLAAQRTMIMKALEGIQQRAQAVAAKIAGQQEKK